MGNRCAVMATYGTERKREAGKEAIRLAVPKDVLSSEGALLR